MQCNPHTKAQLVQLAPLSDFGRSLLSRMQQVWRIRTITDHVRFSTHPGPWLLIEQNHFERWVNLSADRHFRVQWAGWKR